MKKQIAFILAAAMLLTTAACKTTAPEEKNNPSGTPVEAIRGEFAYVPQYVELPDAVTQMSQPVMIDGDLYFTAEVTIGTEMLDNGIVVDVVETRLYKLSVDGVTYSELSAYKPHPVPETADAGAYWRVDDIVDGGDGTLWVYENGNFGYSDENEVYIDDTQQLLRKISLTDGAELAVVDAAAIVGAPADIVNAGPGGSMQITGDMRAAMNVMGISFGSAFSYLRADSEGNLYCGTNDGTIYIFAADGAARGMVAPQQNTTVIDLVNIPSGAVAQIYRDNTGTTHVREVLAATAQLGEDFCSYSGGGFSNPTYAGLANDGESLLFYNSTGAYTLDSSGAQTSILTWLDSDVEANGIFVLGAVSDTEILCMSGISNGGFSVAMGGSGSFTISSAFMGDTTSVPLELIRLVKTPIADIPVRTQLTLAVNAIDQNLRAEVLRFNKRSETHRINVVDYSQYNTTEDPSAGLTKLNTEILNGNIPDIILVRDLPVSTYAARGMLENLLPYIDADTALGGRDAIMPAFLNALMNGDKLHQISSGFTVSTLIGNSDIVGEGDGWTIDELNAVLAVNPYSFLLPEDVNRDAVLSEILSYNLDEYVNPETGECSFDTEEFIKLIEFIKANFSEGTSYDTGMTMPGGMSGSTGSALPGGAATRIRLGESTELLTGRQLLQSKTLRSFEDLMEAGMLAKGNPAFKGYPCESLDSNAFGTTLALAMSSKCADKDGAWEFMRGILTPEYQTSNGGRGYTGGFPSNAKVFEEQAQEAMTENTGADQRMSIISTAGFEFDDGGIDTDGDGVKDVYPKGVVLGADISTTYYYAMTRAEYDRYMAFFNSIVEVVETDNKILEIASDELGLFFSGQKTAQETATVIQSRAKLYVSEQR